jgi:hypothetical protein
MSLPRSGRARVVADPSSAGRTGAHRERHGCDKHSSRHCARRGDLPQPRESDGENRGQRDEAPLPERAGDGPRFDGARDVDLKHERDEEQPCEPAAFANGTVGRPERRPHEAGHRQEGERRPEEESMFWGEDDAKEMRRRPRHLSFDHVVRAEAAIERSIRKQLRYVADGRGRDSRRGGYHRARG